MKKILIGIFIGIVCCVVSYFLISYFNHTKLQGKWYLYSGSDINTESNLSEKLNLKDYIEISSNCINEYTSNDKDGVCTYKMKGDTIYAGDAIYNFTITKVREYKILILRVIGSNMEIGQFYDMKGKVTVKKVSFTFVIFIICLIIYILDFFVLLQNNTNIFSVNHLIQGNDWGILTEYGRLTRGDVFAGQWWRLFTSIFLHAGVLHLAVNMIALLIFGLIVEWKIGSKRYIIIFIGSGIISALFTMPHTTGAVGASGAIYGILGVMIVIFLKEHSYIVYKMSLMKWILLIVYIILPNLSGMVSIIAHVSGLFSGIIITLFMDKMSKTKINKKGECR